MATQLDGQQRLGRAFLEEGARKLLFAENLLQTLGEGEAGLTDSDKLAAAVELLESAAYSAVGLGLLIATSPEAVRAETLAELQEWFAQEALVPEGARVLWKSAEEEVKG